jgi:hypothetical protein
VAEARKNDTRNKGRIRQILPPDHIAMRNDYS